MSDGIPDAAPLRPNDPARIRHSRYRRETLFATDARVALTARRNSSRAARGPAHALQSVPLDTNSLSKDDISDRLDIGSL
jgi:hypothetical protein